MKFHVINDRTQLEGTAYFEFLPGIYNGKCWNDNSIFLDEDSMSIIEGIFEKHIDGYGHFSFSEMKQEEIQLIIAALKDLIMDIKADIRIVGNTFSDDYYTILNEHIKKKKPIVINFIKVLIDWIEATVKKFDRISILGI